MYKLKLKKPRSELGVSIIEILVALAVSLTLVAGISTLIVNIMVGSRVNNSFNVQQDNGRVAIDILQEGIINAGHWAGVDPRLITAASGFSISASGDCNLAWLTDVLQPIQGYDGDSTIGGTNFPSGCIDSSDYVPDTDILVVRYADPKELIPSAEITDSDYNGEFILRTVLTNQTIGSAAQLFFAQDGIPTAIDTGDNPGSYNFIYRSDVYFIMKCCGDDRPALARQRYDGSSFETEILVEYVEQFQLSFASDTNGDFTIDRIDVADDVPNWDDVIGVNVDVVVRNDQRSNDYTDTNDYELVGEYTYTVPESVDEYRRRIYSKTINIRNKNRR